MCSPRVRLDQTELEPKDDDREVNEVRNAAFLLSGFPFIFIFSLIRLSFDIEDRAGRCAAGDQTDRVSFLPSSFPSPHPPDPIYLSER